jgi:putative ABC transport system permease protein
VGVASPGFVGIDTDPVAVWVPTAMASPLGLVTTGANDWRQMHAMAMLPFIARLDPLVPEETALARAMAALAGLAEQYSGLDPAPGVVAAGLSGAVGAYSPKPMNRAVDLSLWVALVAALVLIVACANVANLLLARAVTRRRETAVRLALGAGRLRLSRQHLTEALLLALLGGVAGLLVARWGMELMRQFPLPPGAGELDLRLLLFTLAVSLFTGLLFGVLPSIRAVRLDPQRGLSDARSARTMSRSRTRRLLVAVQVSLSLALLVGAGLSVRSLQQVTSIDSGLDLDRLVAVTVDLRKAGLPQAEREAIWREAMENALRVPGVRSAAMVHFSPFARMAFSGPHAAPGRELNFDDGPYFNMAGAGYFANAGQRLLAGREFEARDATGEPVVIVNERFARELADTPEGALGLCLQVYEQVRDGGCSRIVGVVANQRRNLLEAATAPMLFTPRERAPDQIGWGGPTLIIRVDRKPKDAAPLIRSAVQAVRPELPYVIAQPLEEMVRQDVQPYRLGATLFSLFGGLALILAAIGLYGVLGYFVAERTHEIGIRRSLGAPAGGIVGLVVRQAMPPVLAGLVVGLGLALFGSRHVEALLFGIQPRDPVAFLAAVAFLLLIALVATVVPARRALRVAPMVALRQD